MTKVGTIAYAAHSGLGNLVKAFYDNGIIDGKKHDFFDILEDDETHTLCRPIAGRGLLVGSDAQGGDADARTNILDLALMVKWAEST